jgi:hypothetical protein
VVTNFGNLNISITIGVEIGFSNVENTILSRD